MTNPSDNAFPWDDVGPHPGLTKREHFAAMAMQGFCANTSEEIGQAGPNKRAYWALKEADALIAELNKEKKS